MCFGQYVISKTPKSIYLIYNTLHKNLSDEIAWYNSLAVVIMNVNVVGNFSRVRSSLTAKWLFQYSTK